MKKANQSTTNQQKPAAASKKSVKAASKVESNNATGAATIKAKATSGRGLANEGTITSYEEER